MKNILDRQVSFYPRVHSPKMKKQVSLYDFYKHPEESHLGAQSKIRESLEKSERATLKEQLLPAVTPGGIWNNRTELVEYSGIVALDIDKDHNTHILNFSTLIQQIQKINVVAYCGLSVSGQGYLVMIPIIDPSSNKQHWYALEKDFKSFGINVHPAVKAPNNLRYFSYDPEAYFNTTAETYCKKIVSKQVQVVRRTKMSSPASNKLRGNVESCIDQ
jgi:hypothetical protein